MLNSIYIKKLENNVWYNQLPAIFKTFILTHSHLLYLEKDQTIFYAGDQFNGLYAVLEGSIRLSTVDIKGQEAIAAIVEPIMWFGEISLVDHQPRSHDAVSVQKSVLLHIYVQDLEHLLATYPAFWQHIAQLTTQKLRFAFLELMAIQTQNLTQRLAQRLLFILNGYGNHLVIEKNMIHLTQEQLAHMLVCSRQTINQELQQLEKSNILKIHFKKIEIIDHHQLNNIAHQLTSL